MSDEMFHDQYTDAMEAKAFIIANADKPVIKLHTYAGWQRDINEPFKFDPQFSMHVRCDADALCDAIDQAIDSKETYENYDFIHDRWFYTFTISHSNRMMFLSIKSQLVNYDLTSEE